MQERRTVGRRTFLKSAGAVGAAAAGAPLVGAEASKPAKAAARGKPLPVAAADQDPHPAAIEERKSPYGSDFMIDVMRGLGIEYVAAVPSNTTIGLHESIVNYGMTSAPKLELLTVMHEEISVAMAHGYAKIAGKPMACTLHSTVGLQHASMAFYNAWADRAPVFALVGAMPDAQDRHHFVDWVHSAADSTSLVRDFVKFDDTTVSLPHFGESAARAFRFAMTPPYGPALLAVPARLQTDSPVGEVPKIPALPAISPPQGEIGAVRDVARQLAAANMPVIVADRAARTPRGLELMVALADALQAPVVDCYGRMNFPWRHPLNQTTNQNEILAQADMVLGLEMTDFSAIAQRAPSEAKLISISSIDLYSKSNYQDFNRFTPVSLALAADAEATLPSLIDEIRTAITPARRSQMQDRGKALAEQHDEALKSARAAAAIGWNAKPISVARLYAELYEQIKEDDWSLVNGTVFHNFWPQKLWDANKHYQYIGDAGAYGLGYLPGAAVGAALANRGKGRLTVAVGGDGDFMFTPGAIWTAAHHNIPLLYIIHNNGGYHMERMWTQVTAIQRERGFKDRYDIGNSFHNPNVDFAALARSMGVHGEGPVREAAELRSALRRALAVVRGGAPALVDVISEGR